jgi:hypothetical protein
MRDLLGLVSYLKEQRRCKVILIFNEDVFQGEEADEFRRYVEKVADYNIQFAPSSADCVGIALPEQTELNHVIGQSCIFLGISNIRLIKRITRLAHLVAPIFNKFDQSILAATAKSLALFVWSTYGIEDAPPIDFLKSRRFQSWMGTLKQKDLSPKEQEWNLLLDEYGFTRMEDIDLVLLDGVQKGYFDETKIADYAALQDTKVKAAKGQNDFSNAWSLFHDSFKDNEKEVSAALYSALKNNLQYIDPANANAVISLLKDLGDADRAKELIDLYVGKRSTERDFFDLSQYPFADLITDTEFKAAIEERFRSFPDTRLPTEILMGLGSRGGWSAEDIVALEKLSTDDFYNLFMSLEGEQLLKIVHGSLTFRNLGNASPQLKAISERAVEALVRIAKASKLNEMRVKKFKIGI